VSQVTEKVVENPEQIWREESEAKRERDATKSNQLNIQSKQEHVGSVNQQ